MLPTVAEVVNPYKVYSIYDAPVHFGQVYAHTPMGAYKIMRRMCVSTRDQTAQKL